MNQKQNNTSSAKEDALMKKNYEKNFQPRDEINDNKKQEYRDR